MWAGFADPCATRERISDDDPERDATGAMLAAWYGKFKAEPIRTSALLDQVVREHNVGRARNPDDYTPTEIYTALVEVAAVKGVPDAGRFGRWCGTHTDRMVKGYKLLRATKLDGNNRWCVVRTAECAKPIDGAR